MFSYPTAIRRSIITFSYRCWSSRFAYLASFLLLLLQRSPLLRILSEGQLHMAPRFANILKFTSITSAVQFAGTHAVTGATAPEVTAIGTFTNPADATVGELFAWAFSATLPGKKARSYLIEGLPPGIEFDNNVASSSVASIQGTPTAGGTFNVELTAFHFNDLQGEASPVFELVINVAGGVVTGPVITKALTDQLIAAGESVTLIVEAEGEGLSYAWEKDGVAIPNSDQPQLQLDNVVAADAGIYTVKILKDGVESSSTAEIQIIADGIPIPAGQTLYSVSSRDAKIRAFNADGSTNVSATITLDGFSVTGTSGMAFDPVSETLYAMLKLSSPPNGDVGDRVLAALDPVSGKATFVGNPAAELLLKFSALAFDDAGQLYGVTGNDPNAASPETLFTIDKATGAATEFLGLGNGDQGEALTFDPESGLLVHASGGPLPQEKVLETINLATKEVTPITLQGNWEEGKSLTSLGGGHYLIADETTVYLVTSDGLVAPVGKVDHIAKGMALVPTPVAELEITRIERGANGTLIAFPAAGVQGYVVESSQDLITWEERLMADVGEDLTEVEFNDVEATIDVPIRFYRVSRSETP
ncbi:MAG: hypothetical protein ACI9DF_004483 [Verrucomicrobiales bacterium]|jgi:hypothetical protein